MSGGYHKDADKKNVVVYLPGGAAARKKMFGGISSVLAGSVIEVPFKGEEKGPEVVEVRGAVRNPSTIRYKKGEKLDYYISFCGGYAPDANAAEMVIYLPDGTSVERKGAAAFNPEIEPGTVIEIPFKGGTERETGRMAEK